jgi:hypothetical protein
MPALVSLMPMPSYGGGRWCEENMTSPSWNVLPAPPTPLHAASRDKYYNCRMKDRTGQSHDMPSVAWWARLGETLACAACQDRTDRVECVLLYLFIPVLPPPLPLSCYTVVGITGGVRPMLPKLSSSF